MAKTYKKKQDNFLRNILIGFGSVFVVLFAVMVYFNITELKYEDFQEVGTYDDMDNMPEDVYAVYYYSTGCSVCARIKSQVLQFAEENAAGLKVYMMGYEVTSEVIPGSRLDVVGPGGETLTSFPALIIFEDGQIVNWIGGGEDIPNFIDDVNNGTITFE